MSNMSYCRFENTSNNLNDCVLHWDDNELSDSEKRARERIIELAREIVQVEGDARR